MVAQVARELVGQRTEQAVAVLADLRARAGTSEQCDTRNRRTFLMRMYCFCSSSFSRRNSLRSRGRTVVVTLRGAWAGWLRRRIVLHTASHERCWCGQSGRTSGPGQG